MKPNTKGAMSPTSSFEPGARSCDRVSRAGARVRGAIARIRAMLFAASSACIAVAVAVAAGGVAWAPNEMLVSPQADLLDPEYNQARAQFTWNSADGQLWVGNIDRDTGLFYPPDGKGILLDPNTISISDALKTGNGPEWVWSADGDGIAYTKFKGTRHTDADTRLGYARPLADGSWSAGFLGPDVNRKVPYGSETTGDPSPRISYVDKDNNHYWREVNDPSTEHLLPGMPTKMGPVRFVRGAARAVMYSALVDGVQQVFYRDLDSGQVQQLTFDDGDKDEMWMWQAPEFGGEFVFMTMVGRTELRFYRNLLDAGTGLRSWTPIHSAVAPRRRAIQSPEPFVYQAKSYAFMQMAVGGESFASEIWVSNMDAAEPMFRRVSDNSAKRARTDPEVFITTTHGPMIYYNRRQLTVDSRGNYKYCPGVECSEGIYAADAGLAGPP